MLQHPELCKPVQFHLVSWTAFPPEGFLWSPRLQFLTPPRAVRDFSSQEHCKAGLCHYCSCRMNWGGCCKAERLGHGVLTTLRQVKLSSGERIPGGQRENHPRGQPRSRVSPLRTFLMRKPQNLCLPPLLAPRTAPKTEPEMQTPAEEAPWHY